MTIYAIIIATLTFGAIFSVLTLSLNLQYARGGMINFGTVAYFAAGAYAYAIFTQEPPSGLDQYRFGFDMPWYVGFLAAGVASLLFALVTGWPTLRLRGEYLALTTFAFAEVFHSLLLNERRIGNGSVGLANVERPDPTTLGMSDTVGYALAAVVLMLVTAFVFNRLLKSPFGRTIDAVHDDEIAAQAVGKDDARIRLQVFIISAIPIGFAGALYAMITTLVAPAMFTAEVTFFVWIALVLAGEKTIVGAILGAMALVLFQELVKGVPFETVRGAQIAASVEEIVTGILFILVLRLRPWEKLSKRNAS
ncbi:amino acid/amide ABC transporter membrane protein 2 (HAAT family) [Loktanella sp. PT4BL]|jgi:branched-chain amino acid transport system permease protein|uniref:branched-chain amino acid ABC transporter permease n=1 Tax=Rhodobacterales TaxID=204455 RepID=UPI000D76C74B|nr:MULTISPECIES: branched-chain amino acid ABC transporter permease [Rhodobacterales]PXW66295.1 amino acid/amide ABC transporter membrane protein 2 (HAAT family) [Loktanella sp. PT4BL]HEV8036471.1 branched-chain amino acid ABC transporter permease [Yoonia sp.]